MERSTAFMAKATRCASVFSDLPKISSNCALRSLRSCVSVRDSMSVGTSVLLRMIFLPVLIWKFRSLIWFRSLVLTASRADLSCVAGSPVATPYRFLYSSTSLINRRSSLLGVRRSDPVFSIRLVQVNLPTWTLVAFHPCGREGWL